MPGLRATRGFTLIELLIAVLIIGILAAIALPAFNKQRERAKDSAAQQGLEAGLRAAKAVYADGENFPASGLGAIFARAERSGSFADGATFPAAGTVNVERRSADELVLRTTSRSGNQHMLRLREPASRVERYNVPAEAASGALPVYTNLISNPSFETNASGWTNGGTATLSLTSNWAAEGSQSLRVVATNIGGIVTSGTGTGAMPCVGDAQYTLHMKLNIAASSDGLHMRGTWWDSAGVNIQSPEGPRITGTGEKNVSFTWTAPSNCAYTQVGIRTWPWAGANPTGDWQVDAAMLVQHGRPVGYFDGSSPGAAWTGVAHASTSSGPAPSFSGSW